MLSFITQKLFNLKAKKKIYCLNLFVLFEYIGGRLYLFNGIK